MVVVVVVTAGSHPRPAALQALVMEKAECSGWTMEAGRAATGSPVSGHDGSDAKAQVSAAFISSGRAAAAPSWRKRSSRSRSRSREVDCWPWVAARRAARGSEPGESLMQGCATATGLWKKRRSCLHFGLLCPLTAAPASSASQHVRLGSSPTSARPEKKERINVRLWLCRTWLAKFLFWLPRDLGNDNGKSGVTDASKAIAFVSPVELIGCIVDAQCRAAIHLPFPRP